MKISKEHKDFYRFLWEFLEGGNSAIVIKPRRVGMTSFAERYAAWCADYKDRRVNVFSPESNLTRDIIDRINNFRVYTPTGLIGHKTHNQIIPEEYTDDFFIFDEVDFIRDVENKLRGQAISHFLAYSTINDMSNLYRLKHELPWRLPPKKTVHVFDISNHMENKMKYGY